MFLLLPLLKVFTLQIAAGKAGFRKHSFPQLIRLEEKSQRQGLRSNVSLISSCIPPLLEAKNHLCYENTGQQGCSPPNNAMALTKEGSSEGCPGDELAGDHPGNITTWYHRAPSSLL